MVAAEILEMNKRLITQIRGMNDYSLISRERPIKTAAPAIAPIGLSGTAGQ